jgi:hypothetical protein
MGQQDFSVVMPREIVTIDGADYVFVPPDINTIGQYKLLMERQAIQFVQRNRDTFGALEYRQRMDALPVLAVKGTWDWGGDAWSQSILSDENIKEIAYNVIRQTADNKQPDGKPIDKKFFDELWAGKTTTERVGKNVVQDGSAKNCISDILFEFFYRPN